MSENEIKPVAFDGSELRHGCVQRQKRWSGDTHDDLGGSVDEAATDALMAAAADEIDRLTAERDDALAAVDANWVSHQRVVKAESERDAAVAERDAVRNAIGNDMLKSYIEKHGDPVPLVLELEEAQRKLSVAVAEGKGLVADAERYLLVQASDAECLVRDAERYLDGGRSAGCRLAAKRVRVLLAARAEGGV